jgi:hypothetical protein
MSKMFVAWLGAETKLSKSLSKALKEKLGEAELVWNHYSIEDDSIGDFFVDHKVEPFEWIFVDFTTHPSYKIDLTKIIGKYSTFKSSTLIGVIGKKTDILLDTDFIGLPFNVLCVPKKDVKDIIEDIEIMTGKGKFSDEYFKTMGFNHILWVQMPCKANHKDEMIKLYPHTMDFSPIPDMKKEMQGMKLNEKSMEHIWANQPNDFISITIHKKKGEELFFQANEFEAEDDKFKIKLPPKEVREFGNAISSSRVSRDMRKRVLVFDPQMEFFSRCWGKNYLDEKVNMFNFPYFTSDFRILNALAPDMVIVRASKEAGDGGASEVEVLALIEEINKIKHNSPAVVVFNCPEIVAVTNDKFLKVPFDMDVVFIDKLIEKLVKGGEVEVGDDQVEVQAKVQEWRNARLTNLVFLNLPLIIKEISENHIKVKCPFKLDSPMIVYEPFKFKTYLALTPYLDSNEREAIYSGIFVGEDEDQKTEIRKYVNEINFTPKTEEQQKELQDFHEVNRQKLKEIEKARLQAIEDEKRRLEEKEPSEGHES